MGALVMGAMGSVHCLLMCGPLACATLPGTQGAVRARAAAAYQLSRAVSYAAVGGALGAVGGGLAVALSVSTRSWLPWVMAAALVASALELGKRLRPVPGLSHIARGIARTGAKFSPPVCAAAIGAATPFLPCGLLYGVLAAALASGSFVSGALIAGAFSLGGVPALLAVQGGSALWKRGSHPVMAFVFQRAVPLCAAAVLVFRALQTGPRCH
jgi:uncharacterized protein